MLKQEATHPRPQQAFVIHGRLPAERIGRSVDWPREATLVSCVGTVEWTGYRRGRDRSRVVAIGAGRPYLRDTTRATDEQPQYGEESSTNTAKATLVPSGP